MSSSALLAVDASTGMPCLAIPGLPPGLLGWRSRSGASQPASSADADRLGRIATLLFAMATQLEDGGVGIGAGEWEARWPAAGVAGAADGVRVTPSAVRWVKMGDDTTLTVVDVACTRGRQGVRLLVGLASAAPGASGGAVPASGHARGAGGLPEEESAGRGASGVRPRPIETEGDPDDERCGRFALGEAVAAEVGAQFARRNWMRLSRGGADPGRLSAKFLPHLQGWAWRFRTRQPGAAAGLLRWAMCARASGSDGAGSAVVAGVGRPVVELGSGEALPGWIAVDLGARARGAAAEACLDAGSDAAARLVRALGRLCAAPREQAARPPRATGLPFAELDVPASARDGAADEPTTQEAPRRHAAGSVGAKGGEEARAAAGTREGAAAGQAGALPAPQRPRSGRAASAPAPRRGGRGWLPRWLARFVAAGGRRGSGGDGGDSAAGGHAAASEEDGPGEAGAAVPGAPAGGRGGSSLRAPAAETQRNSAMQPGAPVPGRHGAAGLRSRARGTPHRVSGHSAAVRGSHTLEVPLAAPAAAPHEGPRFAAPAAPSVSARSASAPRAPPHATEGAGGAGAAAFEHSARPGGDGRATACVWVREADWGGEEWAPVDAVPLDPPRVLGWRFLGELPLAAEDASALAAAGPSAWARSACGSRLLFCLAASLN